MGKWKCQEDRHIYLEIKAKESLDEHVDLAIIGINRNWSFRNIKEWGWLTNGHFIYSGNNSVPIM